MTTFNNTKLHTMEDFFSKEVLEATKQALKEIDTELDVNYCEEHKIEFSNSEVDMKDHPLTTAASRKLAMEMLYPAV